MNAANDSPNPTVFSFESSHRDAPDFLKCISPLVNEALSLSLSPELWVVQVDGWFDRKWLGFEGKILGALGVHSRSLRTVVPAFSPGRLHSQLFLRWDAEQGRYVRHRRPFWLHPWQPSEWNLRRTLPKLAPEASFIWYSSSAGQDERASLMAFLRLDGSWWRWYLAFARQVPWRLTALEGIGRAEVNHLAQLGKPPIAS
jgi:hypothetical protein